MGRHTACCISGPLRMAAALAYMLRAVRQRQRLTWLRRPFSERHPLRPRRQRSRNIFFRPAERSCCGPTIAFLTTRAHT